MTMKNFLDLLETLTRLARSWVTHFLAVILVLFAIVLLSKELWNPAEADLETAQGIAAIVGPWVGLVIGFYFGERGGTKQAEAATREAGAKSNLASQQVEQMTQRLTAIDTTKDKYAQLRHEAEEILETLQG
jgi:hypothetical protein